jgi:hypothetical protein
VKRLAVHNREELPKVRERSGELRGEAAEVGAQLHLNPTKEVGQHDEVTRVTEVEGAFDGGPRGETKVTIGGGEGVVGGQDNVKDQAGVLDLTAGVVDGGREGNFGGCEQGLLRQGGGEMAVQHEVKVLSSCCHVQIAAALVETAGEGAETFREVAGLVGEGGETAHEYELIELFGSQGGKVGCSVGIVSVRFEEGLEGLAALTMGGQGPLLIEWGQVLGLEDLTEPHPDDGCLGEDDGRALGEGGEGPGGGLVQAVGRTFLPECGEDGGKGFGRGQGGRTEKGKILLEDGPTVGLEQGVGGEGRKNPGPVAEGDRGDTGDNIFGARGCTGHAEPVDEQGELHHAVVGADGAHQLLPERTGSQAPTQQ